jgi:malate dehydrogenase
MLAGKPGMTRDDLFKVNAGIVQTLVKGIAEFSPNAFTLIISNPVNSTVPIAAEVLQNAGVFNPKRLFGVTTLDVVRAETFVQDLTGLKNPSEATIPVVGGHSGETIVPLFSQAKPSFQVPSDRYDELVNRTLSLFFFSFLADKTYLTFIGVQFGGDEVVKAKDGAGSATLSMAFAGFRYVL